MGVLSQGKHEGTTVPHSTVDKPHGGDKTNGSKHTNGREVLDRIHTLALQNREGCRVSQRNRRHVEGDAQRVERDKRGLVGGIIVHAHPPASQHEGTCQQMTETEHALRLHVFVGHDTHQRGHEDRHYSLNGIEPGNLSSHSCLSKIVTHTREVGSPHGELQEVHHS